MRREGEAPSQGPAAPGGAGSSAPPERALKEELDRDVRKMDESRGRHPRPPSHPTPPLPSPPQPGPAPPQRGGRAAPSAPPLRRAEAASGRAGGSSRRAPEPTGGGGRGPGPRRGPGVRRVGGGPSSPESWCRLSRRRPLAMQRPSGQGTAFSIDSLIGTPPPRSGHLLYTGYPMFMPYRPLVLPQALSHAPLQSGLPPLAPLASFAGRLTNTFCASLGQAVPSMVALTTALPSFSEPPDGFYPPQELPPPRATPDAGCRRGAEGLEPEELPPGRDKGPPEPPLHFPDPFPGLAGRRRDAGPGAPKSLAVGSAARAPLSRAPSAPSAPAAGGRAAPPALSSPGRDS